MSMEYGFYNSVKGDRAYNAEQMSRIFDGLIGDGVYATLGDHLIVTTNPDDTDSIIVGTGRAWFNHTWTYVYNAHIIKGPVPDIVKSRIDAIVLDIDTDARKNQLLWIEGTPGSTAKPTLINTETHHQYPLCYITRAAGNSVYIPQDNIENCVGTSACPFVTGIIDTVDTDELVQKWETQYEKLMTDNQTTFQEWFDNVQGILDEDTAGNLLNKIEVLEEKVAEMNVKQTFTTSLSGKKADYSDSSKAYTMEFCNLFFTGDELGLGDNLDATNVSCVAIIGGKVALTVGGTNVMTSDPIGISAILVPMQLYSSYNTNAVGLMGYNNYDNRGSNISFPFFPKAANPPSYAYMEFNPDGKTYVTQITFRCLIFEGSKITTKSVSITIKQKEMRSGYGIYSIPFIDDYIWARYPDGHGGYIESFEHVISENRRYIRLHTTVLD